MLSKSPVIPGENHPETIFGKRQEEYTNLPAIVFGEGIILCRWEVESDEELQKIIDSRSVYLFIWTNGEKLQPVLVTAEPPQVQTKSPEEWEAAQCEKDLSANEECQTHKNSHEWGIPAEVLFFDDGVKMFYRRTYPEIWKKLQDEIEAGTRSEDGKVIERLPDPALFFNDETKNYYRRTYPQMWENLEKDYLEGLPKLKTDCEGENEND